MKHFLSKYKILLLSIIILLLPLSIITYFILCPQLGFFGEANGADFTDTIFWTQAMIDGKGIFDSSFYYAAFLPFGGNLCMLLFYPFFGLSLTTHACGMLLTNYLLVLGLVLFLKEFKLNPIFISLLISIIMITFGISYKFREMFFGHVIYYSLGLILFIYAFVFYQHALRKKDLDIDSFLPLNKKILYYLKKYGGFCLYFFFVATDGIQILILVTIPISIAIAINLFFSKEKKKQIILLLQMFSSSFLGIVFISILKMSVCTSGYSEAYSTFSPISEWLPNLKKLFPSLFSLIGISKTQEGWINFALYLFIFIVLLTPFVSLIFYRSLSIEKKVLVSSTIILDGFIILGFIVGRLSAANWRLIPMVALSLVTTLILLTYPFPSIKKNLSLTPFLLPFLLVFGLSIKNLCLASNYNRDSEAFEIAKYLVDNNLDYGYATFWQANNITLISGNKTQTRIVSINYGLVNPRYYQSSYRWYFLEKENYYLLLTSGEFNQLSEEIKEKAITKTVIKTKVILVFEEDILTK